MITKFPKLNLTSLYYTFFEGLSKGGSHVLLIAIAAFISEDIYIKIMVLISFEALITMMYVSYYADVLYSFKKKRNKEFLTVVYDVSIIQILIFILLYVVFKNSFDNYFNYQGMSLFIVIFLNGLFSNIIRFYSVCFQLEIKHKQALIYKSLPFFLSFLFCLILFYMLEDKILGFFLGKCVGLSLFFSYIFYKNNDFRNIFQSKFHHFLSLIKRVKFSFAIAIFGWLAGLGFLNFAKIASTNSEEILLVGLIFNIYSILQLFANGINQVYVPHLKQLSLSDRNAQKNYTAKTHYIYILLTLFFVFVFSLIILFKQTIIKFLPISDVLLDGNIFLLALIFFINSFQWVSTPYLMILDKYKNYLSAKLVLNITAWTLIIILATLNFTNILLFYFLIQIFDSIGIFLYVKKILANE